MMLWWIYWTRAREGLKVSEVGLKSMQRLNKNLRSSGDSNLRRYWIFLQILYLISIIPCQFREAQSTSTANIIVVNGDAKTFTTRGGICSVDRELWDAHSAAEEIPRFVVLLIGATLTMCSAYFLLSGCLAIFVAQGRLRSRVLNCGDPKWKLDHHHLGP